MVFVNTFSKPSWRGGTRQQRPQRPTSRDWKKSSLTKRLLLVIIDFFSMKSLISAKNALYILLLQLFLTWSTLLSILFPFIYSFSSSFLLMVFCVETATTLSSTKTTTSSQSSKSHQERAAAAEIQPSSNSLMVVSITINNCMFSSQYFIASERTTTTATSPSQANTLSAIYHSANWWYLICITL